MPEGSAGNPMTLLIFLVSRCEQVAAISLMLKRQSERNLNRSGEMQRVFSAATKTFCDDLSPTCRVPDGRRRGARRCSSLRRSALAHDWPLPWGENGCGVGSAKSGQCLLHRGQ